MPSSSSRAASPSTGSCQRRQCPRLLGADPATGLQGGAVNPSLGATDAIPGVGPPLRPVPGAPRQIVRHSLSGPSLNLDAGCG
ncbi:hypothetical protein FEI13_15610 [Halomonas urmiana]|uniref:Uncharacterized protein n=1 Tax=Halomonas urmiana TaxID=490901 RepID=A0A5R8MCS8_9GAMM|nr:hypothetical protein FEI13_15610 [Halomonas urmiana]